MSGVQCSRLQLPLKLAWAVSIHKAQGLTLDKVVVDVGTKEFSSGLTYVACSRVRRLSDLLFDPPFPYQRLASLGKSRRLQERLSEDARLQQLQATTIQCPSSMAQPSQFATAPSSSASFTPMVATPLPLLHSTTALTSTPFSTGSPWLLLLSNFLLTHTLHHCTATFFIRSLTPSLLCTLLCHHLQGTGQALLHLLLCNTSPPLLQWSMLLYNYHGINQSDKYFVYFPILCTSHPFNMQPKSILPNLPHQPWPMYLDPTCSALLFGW